MACERDVALSMTACGSPVNRKVLPDISSKQARTQACVAEVAKLHWRNHVVQNLRAYFILHVVTIKWIMYVQENIQLSSMSQRPRLS